MLPKIDVPTFELKLPSSGKEIKVRPFLVKEEKLLLIAASTDDTTEIINTTKQVITNCVLSDDFNVDDLPFFDVDYLFIALRAKSISDKIKVNFICQNKVEDHECGHKFSVDIDVSNVELKKNADVDMSIKFGNDLLFKMKYPGYAVLKQIDEKDEVINRQIKIIMSSIEKIFANGQFHVVNKDITPRELEEFIEGLTKEQYNKLLEFTNNFPSFYVAAQGVCPSCGFEHSVRYTDFMRFFQ